MYDVRRFHTLHHHLDANAYGMSDEMNVDHASSGHGNENDEYGGRKHGANATDVDVVDWWRSATAAGDVYIVHYTQNDYFHRLAVDDIDRKADV